MDKDFDAKTKRRFVPKYNLVTDSIFYADNRHPKCFLSK